jgi:hypothetical protein
MDGMGQKETNPDKSNHLNLGGGLEIVIFRFFPHADTLLFAGNKSN